MDISLYSEFCELLNDEYEGVRIAAMKLIQLLSANYKDWYFIIYHVILATYRLICSLSFMEDCEQIRIIDDAFVKVCSMMCDSSIKVRVEAAQLLVSEFNVRILSQLSFQGKFTDVSLDYLHQTFDKKLMSNLKVGLFWVLLQHIYLIWIQ